MTVLLPWACRLVAHLAQLVRPLLHVLLTYLGLRTPPPTTARCSICPDLVNLRGPHLVIARQVESQTPSGRIRVHRADVAAVIHCGCGAGAELLVSPLDADRQPVRLPLGQQPGAGGVVIEPYIQPSWAPAAARAVGRLDGPAAAHIDVEEQQEQDDISTFPTDAQEEAYAQGLHLSPEAAEAWASTGCGPDPAAGPIGQAEAVIATYRLSNDGCGTGAEAEAIFAMQDQLAAAIDAAGVGEFDGNEFGAGTVTMYAYGPDADALFAVAEAVLVSLDLRPATVWLRYGSRSGCPDRAVTLPPSPTD